MTVVGSPDWQDIRQPQGSADQLETFTVGAGQFSDSVTLGETIGQYQRILVKCTPPTTTDISAGVVDAVTGFGGFYTRYTGPGATAYFYLPTSGILGQRNTVQLQFPTAIGTGGMPVEVWGMRSWPADLRYDGLLPCQNSQCISWPNVAGSSVIGFTPSPPFRFLVGAVIPPVIGNPGGNIFAVLSGSVAGIEATIATAFGGAAPASGFSAQFGPGILMDPGTSLTSQITAVAGGFFPGAVYYDLVQ